MSAAVEIDTVSIVFGNSPQSALPLMDAGQSRAEIQAATQQVLGVHDCSLQVDEGEILVLMGLSGSGKSTLLRAVNGLNPVVRGQVRVRSGDGMVPVTGATAADLRDLRLRSVAMVFQQFGLLPWRTVRDNVGLGLELGGVARPRAARRRSPCNSSWWVSRIGPTARSASSRAGCSSAWASPGPLPPTLRSF